MDKDSVTDVDGVGILGSIDSTFINKERPSIVDAVVEVPVGNTAIVATSEVTVTNPIITTMVSTTTTGTSTSTSTTANPINTMAAQYSVPVKSEYVLPERPSSLPSTQRFLNEPKNDDMSSNNKTNSDDRRDNNSNNNDRSQQPSNRKQRGKQNKKRPRDVKISDDHKICRAILRGEPCPYVTTTTTVLADGTTTRTTTNSTCRYIHDLSIYLQTRPPDIQPGTVSIDGTTTATTTITTETPNVTCPIYQLYQYCPYGIMCRFGTCHIDMKTGQNINNNNSNEVTTGSSSGFDRNVCNILSNTLQTSLRKNTYPFQCQRRKHERAVTTPKVNETIDDHSKTNDTASRVETGQEGTSMSATVDTACTNVAADVTSGVDEVKETKLETKMTSKVDDTIIVDHQNTTSHGSTTGRTGNNNYSAYPTKTRKLVDFAI
jgi:hypothetical protein